jgi:hypothetical protein
MLSNSHLMEQELLSNIEGDIVSTKAGIVAERTPSTTETAVAPTLSGTSTARPTTPSIPTAETAAPTPVAPVSSPTSTIPTSTRPAPTGEQVVLKNPETIINVNTTRPTEIPVMIDPIVGVGAGSNPIIMGGGGGGGGMAGSRSAESEEEEGAAEPEKKGSGLLWLLLAVAVTGTVWYVVKKGN